MYAFVHVSVAILETLGPIFSLLKVVASTHGNPSGFFLHGFPEVNVDFYCCLVYSYSLTKFPVDFTCGIKLKNLGAWMPVVVNKAFSLSELNTYTIWVKFVFKRVNLLIATIYLGRFLISS